MSILINMKMPKNCYFCPCSDLEYYDCNLMPGTGISSDWKSGKRLDDCPLVPVPKHGRLIDADAMIEMYEKLIECNKDSIIHMTYHDVISEVIHDLKQAPTVIPADKDGET